MSFFVSELFSLRFLLYGKLVLNGILYRKCTVFRKGTRVLKGPFQHHHHHAFIRPLPHKANSLDS